MRTTIRAALILALAAWGAAAPARAGGSGLSRSVVKIFTVTNQPNYYQPWVMGYQYDASGSGCVWKGDRILTNAHVVSNAVFIQVMKAGDTKRYTAQVDYVDHDREVALLKVKDPSFFKGTRPVELGGLPEQRDKVAVYGFPVGGDELSTTEGVVSRIEVETYAHSQRDFLTIQTDAAINPGNSGGPAFKGGKMIGIAFQALGGAEAQNTGYIVPNEIILRSLKDRANGVEGGAPDLGFYWQKMESPSLRAFYGMKEGQTGVLVTKVAYGSPAWGRLEEQDVVTTAAGVPVADNGTVPFRSDDRLDFSYVVSRLEMGQKMKLGLIRGGRERTVSLTLKPFDNLVAGPQYDVRPSYYIFGGLVFMPLTANYLALWKNHSAPAQLADAYENGLASPQRRQVVFINEVLPHDVNVGYHNLKQAVVVRVNGRPISDLKDVVEAFRHPRGGSDVVELDHHAGIGDNFGDWVVLDARKAEKATKEILKTFRIPRDRSADLEEGEDGGESAGSSTDGKGGD